jgi:hypothetical protein
MSFLTRNLVIREPLVISLLVLLAIVFFAFTHAYSQAYDTRRNDLGQKWFAHGNQELAANQPAAAVERIHRPLLHATKLGMPFAPCRSADDCRPTHQAGNISPAFACSRKTAPSICSTPCWPRRKRLRRNATTTGRFSVIGLTMPKIVAAMRFELIDFYLQRHDLRQAESQLLTLSANPGRSSTANATADLSCASGRSRPDFYKRAARQDLHNLATLLGAGKAALQLGDYRMAESYLLGL